VVLVVFVAHLFDRNRKHPSSLLVLPFLWACAAGNKNTKLGTWRPGGLLKTCFQEPRNHGPMQAPQTPMGTKNVSGNQKTPTGTEKPNPGKETHGNRKYRFGNWKSGAGDPFWNTSPSRSEPRIETIVRKGVKKMSGKIMVLCNMSVDRPNGNADDFFDQLRGKNFVFDS
jgi:hypothetical protein